MNTYYKDQLSKIEGNNIGYPATVKLTKEGKSTNWLSLNNESATELVMWLKENYDIQESKKSFGGDWCLDDILEKAERMEVELSREQAFKVMEYLSNNHDATIGINWEVIEGTINVILENND